MCSVCGPVWKSLQAWCRPNTGMIGWFWAGLKVYAWTKLFFVVLENEGLVSLCFLLLSRAQLGSFILTFCPVVKPFARKKMIGTPTATQTGIKILEPGKTRIQYFCLSCIPVADFPSCLCLKNVYSQTRKWRLTYDRIQDICKNLTEIVILLQSI